MELVKGKYDNAEAEASDDPLVRERARRDVEATKQIQKRMAPPGSLKLPALLEERRLEHGIVDGAFKVQALFERVLVHQISRSLGSTFEGTSILMPDTLRAREEREASIGVVVSAGLGALDSLRSNGIDLGHIVQIIRNAPWRILIDRIDGRSHYLLVLNAGDLLGSYDLASDILSGAASVSSELNEHGVREHVIVRDGVFDKPIKPWISEDF